MWPLAVWIYANCVRFRAVKFVFTFSPHFDAVRSHSRPSSGAPGSERDGGNAPRGARLENANSLLSY